MMSVDEFVHSPAWLAKVSGAQRGRERHAAPATDPHGGRLAARAHPPRPLNPLYPTDAMELADVPRHRPLAFDKMESLIKEMQDPETGVPVKTQKLFLSFIPSAFTGFDVVEWLTDRFNLDDISNVEAINIANQLCQYGYYFPVNDVKNLSLKDDNSLYRFQSPYYWPWQPPRLSGSGSSSFSLVPDNVEYAIYLVKRTLRNKQRHGLEDYEQDALATLKKNLVAKWDCITMQAEEQVRLAKNWKKGDKIISDSQERAYWRVVRPPPGVPSALEPCPVPVRSRQPKSQKQKIEQLKIEIELLKASLDRTRVKTSIALEALTAYSETFTPYDPWLTPPQPSNPWISDDTLFWQINSPLVEVPSEKRVQRWALSIEELVSDPTGLQEFTSFLRKEYSHENIRFWLAVMDLRRSSIKDIQQKLEDIYEEFLKPGAPCEINIDGATAERVAEGMRSGSRYAFDHAAEHIYGLLLKKDCYPRFIRSDHFQRLLTEGRNVLQKKAKFFNFGGQVKKKPGSTSGSSGASGTGLTRRRGSDRSLSGSAHELALCSTQPPRPPDPPSHSHSQSNLTDIPFRDPLEDDAAEVLPWECSSREGAYGARRRQDSTADSGSSSSDVSSAVCIGERTRRLPQQSTLDGGLRGAPPPLRRLSAVEPRHLTPLASPPESPRLPRPTPIARPAVHLPPHPTPTISVSSAPDEECTETPPGAASPDEPRSIAQSDEPSSVFASTEATPTEPIRPMKTADVVCLRTDPSVGDATEAATTTGKEFRNNSELNASAPSEALYEDLKVSEKTSVQVFERSNSSEDDVIKYTLSQEASAAKQTGLAPNVEIESSEVSTFFEGKDDISETISVIERTFPSDTEVVKCSVLVDNQTEFEEQECDASATGSVPSSAGGTSSRALVAPLAELEDIGVDDDHVDKVPSAPLMKTSETRAASESDAVKTVAHRDELTSVSESDIVKRDNKSSICDRKQRNDICPWEDETSCECEAPFVKTYATLGYL